MINNISDPLENMHRIGNGCAVVKLQSLLCFFVFAVVSAVRAETATLVSTPTGGFEEGKYYEFRIAYPTNELKFTFSSGAPFEEAKTDRNGKPYVYRDVRRVTFAMNNKREPGAVCTQVFAPATYPEYETYRLNPLDPKKDFAAMDDVARWQENALRLSRRDVKNSKLRLGVKVDPDAYRFFLDGIFWNMLPRESGDKPGLIFPKGLDVDQKVETDTPDPRFQTVDISERANANGFGRLLAPAGTITNVCGIPFKVSGHPKYSAVDLSLSRFECATRAGLGPTAPSKRWPDPRLKTPLRFIFNVPGGEYDALYVLCATDGTKKNSIPRFTAQFYRWNNWKGFKSGRPFNFSSGAVPVSTNGALHVVKIPLSGDFATELGPEKFCCFELTKDVEIYRTYPDQYHFSVHGAGLPSAVKVLGVTLAKPDVRFSFDPDEVANIFTEGQDISYTVKMENTTAGERIEKLSFSSVSWDGDAKFEDSKEVKLAPGEKREVKFAFQPKRFGWHELKLSAAERTFRHTAVYLRKRDYDRRPFDEPGMRFGVWSTFKTPVHTLISAKLGYDTTQGAIDWEGLSPECRAIAEKYGFASFIVPGNKRATSAVVVGDGLETNVVRFLKSFGPARPGDPHSEDWKYACVLAEPGGIGTGNGMFPEYYGEPENAFDYSKLEGVQKERYLAFKDRILAGMEGLKRTYPGCKRLTPHGNWNFMIPYLQDPDTRNVFDGVQGDFQLFTHLPEEQVYETSIHSLYFFKNAWEKYRPGEKPFLCWGEGPDIFQVMPGASTEELAAAHRVRVSILLAGYGVDWQFSWATDPISYAETHCDGGFVTGCYARNPDWSAGVSATWTRLTRHATFESYSDTGSKSAFCANFRDHRTGKLFRAIWTVRGKREFVFDCAPAKLEVLDPMDNIVAAVQREGKSVVTVGTMPYFVFGADDAVPSVGAADHSDSAVKPGAVELGNMADLFKEQTADEDDLYINTMSDYMKRFRTEMDVKTADSEKGKVLSVGLSTQKVDRMLMPYFTCLSLKKPVQIPGKAEFIRLDVKASSDWGRVVFVLKDAEGKPWYSCGRKGTWNADDMTGESFFCFDGWRTLKIELPSNSPWDGFREKGFYTWGSDELLAEVKLPLSIEKVFVERRSGVMYGNEFVKFAEDTPVLLGNIYAEYASESDKTPECVKLRNLRGPTFPVAGLPNPIKEMTAANPLPPGKITAVKDPETWFNGTNGEFFFELPPEAVSWDVYLSLYPDGKGALLQASALKKNPGHVANFIANTDFYAYVVWRDKDGNLSKPSEPFKFKLEDHFANQ